MMEDRKVNALIFICSIFFGLLAISSLLSFKILDFGFIKGPGGVIAYAFTFICTDTLAEIWGRKTTARIVNYGFVLVLIALLVVQITVHIPGAIPERNEVFNNVMGGTMRIYLASIIAYLVSQNHDVWAFEFWKKKTGGKHLWLRNNASTLVSQTLDTVLFVVIAFAGTGIPLMVLIPGQLVCKLVLAALDTPLVYASVKYTKKYIDR